MPLPILLSTAAKALVKKVAIKGAAKAALSKVATKQVAKQAIGSTVKSAATSVIKDAPKKLISKGLETTTLKGNKLGLDMMSDPKVNPPAPQSGLSKIAETAKKAVKGAQESGGKKEKPEWSKRGPIVNSLSNMPSPNNEVYLEQIDKLKQIR